MAPKKKQADKVYLVGELVAVKLKGHPCWPAEVEYVDRAGTRPKYRVRFFGGGTISSTSASYMKPFDEMTQQELSAKKKNLVEAIDECRQKQLAQTNQELPPEQDEEIQDQTAVEQDPIKMDLDPTEVDLNQNIATKEQPIEKKNQTEKKQVRAKRKKDLADLKHDEPVKEQEQIDRRLDRSARKRNQAKTKQSLTAMEQSSLETKREACDRIDEQVDLKDDLTKSNHSLSESAIDHNSCPSLDCDENAMQNPTIEKLKKKIARKMQEKEALKITRLQKKAYERASKKFPTVYKKLDQILMMSEKLLKLSVVNKKTPIKLEDAHSNLEATLLKCIDKLTTDYGKSQSDCSRFQAKLTRIIRNLKQVRETQRTKNPDLAKVAKRVLKVYKTKAIREFINDSEIADALDDVMIDRKENDAIKV